MIFLGDPAQLKPVMGEPIYGEGSSTSTKPERVRGCRGRRQTQYHLTSKGQELYRKYLLTNCILLNKGQRNCGLLQQSCDRVRSGKKTYEDLTMLTWRRINFPTFQTDFTLHYDTESCSFTNLRHLLSECRTASPLRKMYGTYVRRRTTPLMTIIRLSMGWLRFRQSRTVLLQMCCVYQSVVMCS